MGAKLSLVKFKMLLQLEDIIHEDELTTDPSEAQALCRTSRIRTLLKRYGFLISEQKDVLFIENNEPTTYEESLNSSEFDKWLTAMKAEMDSMYTSCYTLVRFDRAEQ